MKNFCCKVSGTGSIAHRSLAPSLFSEPSAKTSRPCLEKFILSGGDFLQSALSHCLSLSLSLSLAPEWMGGMSRVGLLFRPHQWKLPSAQRELEAPNAIALPSKLSAKCENQERERERGRRKKKERKWKVSFGSARSLSSSTSVKGFHLFWLGACISWPSPVPVAWCLHTCRPS